MAFTLRSPEAGFATTQLGLWIESKAAVDASYARFAQGVEAVTVREVTGLLDRVSAEEAAPTGPDRTVDYGQFRTDGEALLRRAGCSFPNEPFHTTDGVLDIDRYVGDILARIRAIDASFTSRPIDALAAAYPYLDVQDDPVGTGPFAFASYAPGTAGARRQRGVLPRGARHQARVVPRLPDGRRGRSGARERRRRLAVPTRRGGLRRDLGRPGRQGRGVPRIQLPRPLLQSSSRIRRALPRAEPAPGRVVLVDKPATATTATEAAARRSTARTRGCHGPTRPRG